MSGPRGPLRRSRRYRIVAGVCGGLAVWLGWRPTVVRVLFVLVGALPLLAAGAGRGPAGTRILIRDRAWASDYFSFFSSPQS